MSDWFSSNTISLIPIVLSVATAIGASYALQARHDERLINHEHAISQINEDLKDKVDQRELEELKGTLNEMKSDIKKLLIRSGNGH